MSSKNCIRTDDEYIAVRRDTSGVRPCFASIESNLSLPQEVVDHPVLKEMETLGVDMILLFNVSMYVPQKAQTKLRVLTMPHASATSASEGLKSTGIAG